MQGRLSPPVGARIQAFPAEHWRDEFPLAKEAGLSCIEWIDESFGRDSNPLCSDRGIAQMHALAAENNVAVRSVCADYFMEFPLVRTSGDERAERLDHLRWLVDRCRAAKIQRIVLPFVDASDVRDATEEAALAETLVEADRAACAVSVELHVEMALPPARFAAFLERVPDTVLVNYDSGNSASLGYHPDEEFNAYGSRIGSVHVKDRYAAEQLCRSGRATRTCPRSSPL